jgi:uncharacterized membrane protein YeaQ/YmgE (transglycosylase-associated protein family)
MRRVGVLMNVPADNPEGMARLAAFLQGLQELGWTVGRNRETIMTIEALIIWLVIGTVVGWLAGQIVRGYGFGLISNIVIGMIGAVIAGWLLPLIGVAVGGSIIAAIINAIGAVILWLVVGLFSPLQRAPGL